MDPKNMGEIEDIRILREENKYCPYLEKKMDELEERFEAYRKTRGDGNCFYRAIAYGYIERAILKQTLPNLLNLIEKEGSFFDFSCVLKEAEAIRYKNELLKDLRKILKNGSDIPTQLIIFQSMVDSSSRFDLNCVKLIRNLVGVFFYLNMDINVNGMTLEQMATAICSSPTDFIHNIILKMGEDAQSIIFIIVPIVLRMQFESVYLDFRDSESTIIPIQFSSKIDEIDFVLNDGLDWHNETIHLLLVPGHYSLLYSKEYLKKFKDYLKVNRPDKDDIDVTPKPEIDDTKIIETESLIYPVDSDSKIPVINEKSKQASEIGFSSAITTSQISTKSEILKVAPEKICCKCKKKIDESLLYLNLEHCKCPFHISCLCGCNKCPSCSSLLSENDFNIVLALSPSPPEIKKVEKKQVEIKKKQVIQKYKPPTKVPQAIPPIKEEEKGAPKCNIKKIMSDLQKNKYHPTQSAKGQTLLQKNPNPCIPKKEGKRPQTVSISSRKSVPKPENDSPIYQDNNCGICEKKIILSKKDTYKTFINCQHKFHRNCLIKEYYIRDRNKCCLSKCHMKLCIKDKEYVMGLKDAVISSN